MGRLLAYPASSNPSALVSEGSVPGQRVSSSRRKIDIVLVAVRYADDGRQMELVRGFERRGPVWSDLVLLDRSTLIELVGAGRRVVTGREKELPGDFEVLAPVRIMERDGHVLVMAGAHSAGDDSLGLPRF
jgi:hypothetical protein